MTVIPSGNSNLMWVGLALAFVVMAGKPHRVEAEEEWTKINMTKISNEVRAQQIGDMKFGMFVCWSFSTFSGYEWTPGVEDISFFKP